MRLRLIMNVNGILLLIMTLGMIFPMLADLYFGYDDWKVFFTCIIVTAFFGGAMILSNARKTSYISPREGFLIAASSWIVLAIFAALPFYLSSLKMSPADSFFEAMSGITTTGSTVITDLNHAPAGILLWRAMLQWLGGIGVIILSISILPFLNVGGMQIFRTEQSENERVSPRTKKLVADIIIFYLCITILCAISYMGAGFEVFDAIAHSMTTVSTGGFSTFDNSFAHFNNIKAQWVAIIFMIMGGMPFILYIRAAGGSLKSLYNDTQVRWFLGMIALATLLTIAYLYSQKDMLGQNAVHFALFNVVSIITGTGFTNGDYSNWGGFCISMIFFLMIVGGCAGSTSSGVKIFRFKILYSVAAVQLKKLIYPHGVFLPHYNKKPIPESVPASVMSFFFLYALCFAIVAIGLSLAGLDFITSLSAAVTSISNVGPGIGPVVGPSGTFQPLPDSAKWLLSLSMLLGRLEIFTVLVMLSPYFWKK